MRLFVLGSSGSGKTPLARQVADALGVPHVMASAWVRRLFPEVPGDDRQARIEAMTRFSLQALQQDPLACLSYLERHDSPDRPCVIEGMRNPSDFVRTFDPRSDRVVVLEHRGSGLRRTSFEGGLDVIRAWLDWQIGVGLLGPDRVLERPFDRIEELDGVIAEVRAWCSPAFAEAPTGPTSTVHADVEPLRLEVREGLLYGNDPARVGWVPCTVFAVSCYPGSAPTFQIRLDDGAVFSYVPPSALSDPALRRDPVLPLSDLVYHGCPSGFVAVQAHRGLAGPVLAYFKHRDLWMAGTYRFTVDWYRGNELLHCLLLENGQLAFLPNHKVKFGDHAPGFAPYKKLRNEWRVGDRERLELVALVVRDYDGAIRFFVDVMGFELVEDSPSLTNDGRPKRWVVVRPEGAQTGLLLARADGDEQDAVVGRQFAGRVGLFLRVPDFDAAVRRMEAAGVRFVSPPRDEPYGRVAVFLDLEGNKWDLISN